MNPNAFSIISSTFLSYFFDLLFFCNRVNQWMPSIIELYYAIDTCCLFYATHYHHTRTHTHLLKHTRRHCLVKFYAALNDTQSIVCVFFPSFYTLFVYIHYLHSMSSYLVTIRDTIYALTSCCFPNPSIYINKKNYKVIHLLGEG